MQSRDIKVGGYYAYFKGTSKSYTPDKAKRVKVTGLDERRWSESTGSYRRDGVGIVFCEYSKDGSEHNHDGETMVVPANRIQKPWGEEEEEHRAEREKGLRERERKRDEREQRKQREQQRWDDIQRDAAFILELNGLNPEDNDYKRSFTFDMDDMEQLLRVLQMEQ